MKITICPSYFRRVPLGQFVKQQILLSYQSMGAKTVGIMGFSSRQAGVSANRGEAVFSGFSYQNDLLPLYHIFPQISALSPTMRGSVTSVSFAGQVTDNQFIAVTGTDERYLEISNEIPKSGRNFTHYDIVHHQPVCLLGEGLRDALFKQQYPIDQVVYLQTNDATVSCQVIGILPHQFHSPQSILDPNMRIIMPYTFMAQLGMNYLGSKFGAMLVKVHQVSEVVPTANAIKHYFQLKYGHSGIFAVNPNVLLLQRIKEFILIFTILLASIASISLLISGIGITNMMLVSISEQLREIGIRKALGASDSDMRNLFLFKPMLICVIAGLTGVVLGFVIYQFIIYLTASFIRQVHFQWYVSPLSVILSLIAIIVIAILSGILPARKAKKLDILTCLRYE